MRIGRALQKLEGDQKKHLLKAIIDDIGTPDGGMWDFINNINDGAGYENLAYIKEDMEASRVTTEKKRKKGQTSWQRSRNGSWASRLGHF